MMRPEPQTELRAGVLGRLSVGFVLLPNFTLGPFAGFIDVLRLAADEGDRSRPRACAWTVMTPDLRPVRASCGVTVQPWETLGRPERFDYVVLAGGLLPPPERRMLDAATRAFLQQARHRLVCVIGLCTGAVALAEAGLMRPGSRCCISWYHFQDVQERCPDVQPVADRLWVRDGRMITCAGGTAAIDLAASLVATHIGPAAAQKSLHIMLSDGPRGASAAQPQPPNTIAVADARVRRAMLLIEQNLATPLSAEALAAQVPISKRQLERLFRRRLGVSLQEFGRDLRLCYAVWLMARGTALIGDVAVQCGFADAAHFTRTFRRAFNTTPSDALQRGPEALQRLVDGWWRYGDAARRTDATLPAGGGVLADRRPFV